MLHEWHERRGKSNIPAPKSAPLPGRLQWTRQARPRVVTAGGGLPRYRRTTGDGMLSIITFTTAGLPLFSARSSAAGRSAADSTSSP